MTFLREGMLGAGKMGRAKQSSKEAFGRAVRRIK